MIDLPNVQDGVPPNPNICNCSINHRIKGSKGGKTPSSHRIGKQPIIT